MTKRKIPPEPTLCIFDADVLLFKSCSSGEKVWYIYKDKDGNEVVRFDSAEKGKNWIDEFETFGCDAYHGYKGKVEDLTRETFYDILDVEECYKCFDNGLKKVLKQSGCDKIIAGISKSSGAKVFRCDVATMREYKKGRDKARKPHHLEAVRKYARNHPDVIVPRAKNLEVDDWVVIQGTKYKHKCCVAFADKDGLQGRGFWLLHLDKHEKPVWSTTKTLGRIGVKTIKGKEEIRKIGHLSLMYQMICGDNCDGIIGLKGGGEKLVKELLLDFDNKPIEMLPELVRVVLREYYRVYGLAYTYPHWNGSGEVTASYKDIFQENLLLLWMQRFKDDDAREIMDIVDEIEFEEDK